jgi:hypothetical protein
MVSWLRFGPETKPSHQEAIPANTSATPASAGSFNQSIKTPLLAAEGFMILRILIRPRFGVRFQCVGGKYLTAWGWLADLTGAEG